MPLSPIYINALVLFNGKSLPTFVNHTIGIMCTMHIFNTLKDMTHALLVLFTSARCQGKQTRNLATMSCQHRGDDADTTLT